MATNDIQLLLQKCLEGYDAGLTPDECLSAYPRVRRELEPLFRQAIALRVAYAGSPREEFRFQARERLMFAVGRDVTHALAVEPDEAFVQATRQRLLNTAGASAQEALRDVPPPRLPFWSNARRHLLETAATTPPKPAPHFNTARVRTAVSAVVVVLAVAVAGAGFFVQSTPTSESPRTAAGADLLYLTEQIGTVEQMTASGQGVSPAVLDELATLTGRLATQSSQEPELKARLPGLIERQQELAEQLSPNTSLDETLATAQDVLNQSSEPSAVAAETEPTPTEDTAAATEPTPEATPSVEPSATPELDIPTTASLIQPSDLAPGQVAYQLDPSKTELGIDWVRVTTTAITFEIPAAWTITNLDEVDDRGISVQPQGILIIETDIADVQLAVTIDGDSAGEVMMLNGEGLTLRSDDAVAVVIDAPALMEATNADPATPRLLEMLWSFQGVTPEVPVEDAGSPLPDPTASPEPSTEATSESESQ